MPQLVVQARFWLSTRDVYHAWCFHEQNSTEQIFLRDWSNLAFGSCQSSCWFVKSRFLLLRCICAGGVPTTASHPSRSSWNIRMVHTTFFPGSSLYGHYHLPLSSVRGMILLLACKSSWWLAFSCSFRAEHRSCFEVAVVMPCAGSEYSKLHRGIVDLNVTIRGWLHAQWRIEVFVRWADRWWARPSKPVPAKKSSKMEHPQNIFSPTSCRSILKLPLETCVKPPVC